MFGVSPTNRGYGNNMSKETINRLVGGPITRLQFAMAILTIWIIIFGLTVVAELWPRFLSLRDFTFIILAPVNWVAFTKRIYDIGRPGIFGLVALVPVLSVVALIYLLAAPTSRRGQKFVSCPECHWHEWYRTEAIPQENCPSCKESLVAS